MTFESHNPATGELIGTDPEHGEAETNLTTLTINGERRQVDVHRDHPLAVRAQNSEPRAQRHQHRRQVEMRIGMRKMSAQRRNITDTKIRERS
jgi:hypothetical protein